MNAFVKKLVLKTIYRNRQKKFPGQGQYSRFELAKEFLALKITAANLLRDAFFMALGVLSAAFGLESFLIPNNFIDGGATGISLLPQRWWLYHCFCHW